jgi:leucyl-tRNA synthetase
VNGLPQMIDAKHLPIVLPEVEKYLPTEDGQPPLGNATDWAWDSVNNKVVSNELVTLSAVEGQDNGIYPLELNTMPGWAGSSWYWMRYMDAHNDGEFASQDALKYWENVDLYIGGSEHATGHLLYSRFWNKFLKDIGYAPTEEPFKKLINQGMILGMSAFAYGLGIGVGHLDANLYPQAIKAGCRISPKYVVPKETYDLWQKGELSDLALELINKQLEYLKTFGFEAEWDRELTSCIPFHVEVEYVDPITNELDIDKFKKGSRYNGLYIDDIFPDKNGKYITTREVEKMSKSKYNVVNPDDICNDYGADTLRLYEMFLGPLEQAKPWNTAGITGVSGFLKKLWRLYFDDNGSIVTNDEPSAEMYKSLHKTIKKVTEDIENFSFNTSVSQFMICVNELATLKCHHRNILEPLAILVSPYAPHIAEELYLGLQDTTSLELQDYKGISEVPFPVFDPKYLVESEKEYPVSFNGKMRFTLTLPLDLTKEQIQEIVLADERTIAQLAGNTPKNIIIVPGKIINLVG